MGELDTSDTTCLSAIHPILLICLKIRALQCKMLISGTYLEYTKVPNLFLDNLNKSNKAVEKLQPVFNLHSRYRNPTNHHHYPM